MAGVDDRVVVMGSVDDFVTLWSIVVLCSRSVKN